MRLGNTLQEMELSPWVAYSPDVPWYIRTGDGPRFVYAEFRDVADQLISRRIVWIEPYNPALGTQYDFPVGFAVSQPGFTWKQDFSDGPEFWSSYDYNGGDPLGANVFYPASHSPDGGPDNAGYIWTDDSRWRIDTPENPHSVLALLTYAKWHRPDIQTIDTNAKTVSFQLRGQDLDLKGGTCFFWMLTGKGRWHKRIAPLTVNNSGWSANAVTVGTYLDWHKSFDNTPGAGALLETDLIVSWGISFTDFSSKPTGRVELAEFRIS